MPVLGKIGVPGKIDRGSGLPPSVERALRARGADAYQPSGVRVANATGAERACGARSCAGGWTMPWKNRRRPIFEGEWGCSTKCVESLVKAAVRRETGDGAASDWAAPHRHRVPLGLVLLAQGWITHPQLRTALDAQRQTGRGRVGEWLVQECGLEEDRITRGLGMQWSCPVLTTERFSPAAMALVMPKRFVAEFGLVPLRVAGSSLLYLAFQDQMNAAVALGVEQMSGLKVESGLLPGSEFEAARASVLAADAVPVRMSLVGDADALTAAIVKALAQRQPVATRLVRVHHYYWMRMWLESGAMSSVGSLPSGVTDIEDQLFMIGKQ